MKQARRYKKKHEKKGKVRKDMIKMYGFYTKYVCYRKQAQSKFKHFLSISLVFINTNKLKEKLKVNRAATK